MALIDQYISFKNYFRNNRLLNQTNCSIKSIKNLASFGSDYGGWTIPTKLLGVNSICYCVGAGEDISFDLAIARRFQSEVHIFDPTPRSKIYVNNSIPDIYREKVIFHDIGLWKEKTEIKFHMPVNENHVSLSILNLQNNEDSIVLPVNRLSDVMDNLGHNSIDLLKLDIEGAEYEVINSIFEDKLNIKAIAIEFDEAHSPIDNKYILRIREAIKKLLDLNYQAIHVEKDFNILFVKKEIIESL